jgi:hypothetical protein
MQAKRLRRRSLKVEDVSHTGTEDIAEERLWLVCQGRAGLYNLSEGAKAALKCWKA